MAKKLPKADAKLMGKNMETKLKIEVLYSQEDAGYITRAIEPNEFDGLSAWGPTIEDSLDEFINAYMVWD